MMRIKEMKSIIFSITFLIIIANYILFFFEVRLDQVLRFTIIK